MFKGRKRRAERHHRGVLPCAEANHQPDARKRLLCLIEKFERARSPESSNSMVPACGAAPQTALASRSNSSRLSEESRRSDGFLRGRQMGFQTSAACPTRRAGAGIDDPEARNSDTESVSVVANRGVVRGFS